ncbi:MAG TPA: hypothetical protein VER04_25745 [Polyangiaceae bacterium]|nr:hypothetical protein [Polyangiaceae bacterium]
MKTSRWGWLALLLLPGCLLVQPLDEAKPASEDNAGSGGKASGNAGQHSGGSGASTAGTGNRAGSGSMPTSGAANGGAGSGVDFSLFTGTWTISAGKGTVTCDEGTPTTDTVDPGGTTSVGPGTVSDLIFDPGADCEILADVSNRTASLNSATSECYSSDSTYDYESYVESFEFVVSGDGKTAKATMTSTVYVTDADGAISICETDYSWDYER